MSRLARFALLLLPIWTAAPAAAQIAPRHDYEDVGPANPFIGDSSMGEPGFGRQIGNLRNGISDARKSGRLSRAEARRLNREARAIARLASRYGQDGLSPGEHAELTTRTQVLREAVTRSQTGTGMPKSGR
jgi:hypothetical protein